MSEVVRFGSDGRGEEFGHCRMVAAGPHAWVSGCTAVVDGVLTGEGDPHAQATAAFRAALAALAGAGFDRADVVRTRMYVVHARDAEEVGRAHRELFGEVRPAATLVVVAGLTGAGVLVEAEVEAYRSGRDELG